MHHLGEKTKINLDLGRFCIIFVSGFMSLFIGWVVGVRWRLSCEVGITADCV